MIPALVAAERSTRNAACKETSRRPRPQDRAEDREEPFIAEIRPGVDAAVDRALERLQSGAGRAVEPEIKALLKEHPDYHSTHFAMGVYLAAVVGDPAGAVTFFEKATQIFPPYPEAHFNLGNAARLACDVTKAVKAYRAAVHYSQAGDGIAEMAREELRVLERILLRTTSFRNLDAYLANAKLFDEAFERLANRDFENAIQLFGRVLLENPDHVQSFGNMALAYAGLGKRAAAMECFEKALALDPQYEPAIFNRRITEKMREGEPFVPDAIQQTYYYAERLNRAR